MKTYISPLKYQILIAIISMVGIPFTGFANEIPVDDNDESFAEFDPLFLKKSSNNQSDIDISQFSRGNPILPGNYRLDVFVNQQWRGVLDVQYIENSADKFQAKLCVKPSLIEKIDLKDAIKQSVLTTANSQGCLNIHQYITDSKIQSNLSQLRLDIEVPQIFVEQRPEDFVNPNLWDSGVNTIFASYQLNHYQTKNDDNFTTEKNGFLGLNTGTNIGRWHFRHNGAFKWSNNSSQDTYQAFSTYLKTDLPSLRSQMTLGDFYSDSLLFDGVAMRGLQINSDDRMLPASIRNYAPVIRGIANSNANVSIYQNNNLIFNTTVPPGEFELKNIRNIYGSGDLQVVITEADGTKRSSTIAYNGNNQLLRPKHSRYHLSLGRVRYDNTHLYDDKALQATWQYGINNHWTLNTGTILSENYQSFLLGSVLNTPIGSFGLNAISSKSDFIDKNQTGHRIRLQYNRFFEDTKTGINAYIQRQRKYYSLGEVASFNHLPTTKNATQKKDSTRWQISANQNFGKKWGSLYAFYSRTHQQDEPIVTQWQVGYNNHIKRLNYGFFASQNKSETDNRWDKQYMVSLSLPLDAEMKHQLHGHYSYDDNATGDSNNLSHISLTGSFNKLPNLSYGISANHNENAKSTTWSANTSYNASFANLNASYSDTSNSKQFSVGATGSMVAHQYGMLFANTLGDTFGIVHVPNGYGAKIASNDNLTLNTKGYVIAPNLSPYQMNDIHIDPKGLPFDIQLDNTSQQIAPRADSSVLINFKSRISRTALFDIKLSDGSYPAIGANIFDDNEQHIGFITQGGRALLQNLSDKGKLTIHWGQDKTQQCTMNYQLPKNSSGETLTKISAICHQEKKYDQ